VLAAGPILWQRSSIREAAVVRQAFQNGRFETANEALERWLRTSPNSAAAQFWRARIALALRRPQEAAEALQKAEALGEDPGRLKTLRAIAAGLSGRFAEAEPVLRDSFNTSAEPDPLRDEVLAKIYLETYDLPRAEVALKHWMRDAQADAKPYLWRAEVDSRTDKASNVENDYREALRRDPGLAAAQLGLAEELRKAHRTAEALEVLSGYLAQKPDDPAGYLAAGRNAAEQGDTVAAVGHLKRALSLDSRNSIAYKELAELLMRQGDFSAALGLMDQAVAVDPFDIAIRHGRGIALGRLGRHSEAEAEQAHAARLRVELDELLRAQSRLVGSPRDLESQRQVMRWMFTHGKGPDGVRWAEAILRDQPDESETCRMLANLYRARSAPSPAP